MTFFKEEELRNKLVKTFKSVGILISDGTTPEQLADTIIKYVDEEFDTKQEYYEQGYRDGKAGN